MGNRRGGKKKKQDFSKVEFLTIEEGLCVQCMHIGPLMTNREPSPEWISIFWKTGMKMIFQKSGFIMKFIFQMQEELHLRSGGQ